jgi:hypothetical protein
MREKELLKRLGEETLYSAKGHFKACDIRRESITYTIWICSAINVLGIVGAEPTVDKWLAALGLFGTIALLIWNEGEGKDFRAKHKEAAEKYLALHKEIRAFFFTNNFDRERVEELSNRVINFDRSDKPEIPALARRLAKRAIERLDPETDNWFK